MRVIGYKCFNKNMINNYGKKFSLGKIYVTSGALKQGYCGNGFHMCENIEDTFRFFDTSKFDINVCSVIGYGDVIEYTDEYNGYYNMYCVQKLEIEKILSREELINIGLNLNNFRAERFVSTLSLTPNEIKLFKEKYKNNEIILKAIAYHHENDKTAYYKK